MDDIKEVNGLAGAALKIDGVDWEKSDALEEHLARLTRIATSLRAEIEYIALRKAQFKAALPLPDAKQSEAQIIRRRQSDPLSVESLRIFAETEYRRRRVREKFLPKARLEEPGWDILLDLYRQPISAKGLRVTQLCIGSSVPPTTALRWIRVLAEEGLLESCDDAVDRRVRHVHLTQKGFKQTSAALAAMIEVSMLYS